MTMKDYLKISLITILIGSTAPMQAASLNKAVAFVQDSVITATVKAKIATNNNLPSDLKVTTNDGVVVISGTVNSDREQTQLVQIAQTTDGVKSVDTSKLLIKDSISPMDDFIMTVKIKGLFLREKLLGNQDIPVMDISVSSKNGIVYLSGVVASAAQEKHAVDLAKTVAGVTRVESTIKIMK